MRSGAPDRPGADDCNTQCHHDLHRAPETVNQLNQGTGYSQILREPSRILAALLGVIEQQLKALSPSTTQAKICTSTASGGYK